MKVTTPSDRVQLIDRGSLLHPGCCALCGSGNCDEGYVDTGIYYDYEGQVYFCWNCAMQIAAVIGCLSADEHGIMRALLEETAAKLKATEEELGNANERLNTYDTFIIGAINSSDARIIALDPESAEAQPSAGSTESAVNSEPAALPDDGKSVAKKSTTRRRPASTTRTASSNGDDSGFTL